MGKSEPLRQIGWIVRDADAAARVWADVFGVRPFCIIRRLSFENFHYRGVRSESPVVTIAVGHSGPLQVEIIQQHDDTPSVYRDFVTAGYEGMQHLSAWYSDAAGYDLARSNLVADGLSLVQEGLVPGVDVRFAYFERPDLPAWPQYEISEALRPTMIPLLARLEELSRTWNCEDPLIEGLGALFAAGVSGRR